MEYLSSRTLQLLKEKNLLDEKGGLKDKNSKNRKVQKPYRISFPDHFSRDFELQHQKFETLQKSREPIKNYTELPKLIGSASMLMK